MPSHILAIDQGTTSSRAIVFDDAMRPLASAQQEFTQIFPADGWVEHDPMEIWRSVQATCKQAIQNARLTADDIAAIGITNQRETVVVWDRETGAPIHNAVVWQDRRTASLCDQLKADGHEAMVQQKTGLLLDPYFSGTKLKWLLDHVDGARAKADAGKLAFGTIDTWLVWQLTGGTSHVTDVTNASRTLIYNIDTLSWDQDLCALLDIPMSLLPDVRGNAASFGETSPALFGRAVPITGIAGDQQAASIGQACFEPGMLKSTYGTGCFALMNVGTTRAASENRLLSTIGYQLDGETHYALEGSIFMAGATIQWVRDGLKLIESASDSEALARDANPNSGVYLVPAFVGLGAPYWDADARGAILGLTRDSGIKEIVRAAIESVCYQTCDLMTAMAADRGTTGDAPLRVDGGMVANDWAMQRLADLTGQVVERPKIIETTALGAAYLAAIGGGVIESKDQVARDWARDRLFEPKMSADERAGRLAGWADAVGRVLTTKA